MTSLSSPARSAAPSQCSTGAHAVRSHSSASSHWGCAATRALAALALAGAASAHAQDTPDWFAIDGFEFASPPTVFRVSDLDLRDPHVFLRITLPPPLPPLCQDFTDQPIPGTSFSLNGEIQNRIRSDVDPLDGYLDASTLFWFRPLALDGRITRLDSGGAGCFAPFPPAACEPIPNAQPSVVPTAVANSGICLAPIAGTTTPGSPYSPAIATPSAPCFLTPPRTIEVWFGDTPITLVDAQYAGSLVGSPPTAIANGLLRGFLRESDANAILLPNPADPAQSFPLSSFLPGGAGNCSSRNDKDLHRGESGWWFYFNFVADPVAWTGG